MLNYQKESKIHSDLKVLIISPNELLYLKSPQTIQIKRKKNRSWDVLGSPGTRGPRSRD